MPTRRQFLRRSALGAAGVLAAPYLLPSGRAFAKTGSQSAKHVVLVLFAGGVRQQETVLQRYLADSQGLAIEGNVMPNLLRGALPDEKIVFGTTSAGSVPIPTILTKPLAQLGTLLPEMRFSGADTGHYTGLSTALSGHYGPFQGLQQRPLNPTIFEYLRRHGGAKATDVWFVGNGLTGSIPLLNHSGHADYGARYGANMLIPTVTFGRQGRDHLQGARVFHPEEELPAITQMRTFLNQRFTAPDTSEAPLDALGNTEAEKLDIKRFIAETFSRIEAGALALPPVNDSDDLITIAYACEVMRYFRPKLTVVNLSSADTCHNNFTGYLRALHRADHGVGFLWNYLQTSLADLAPDTAIVMVPEHGRNLVANNITDVNNWRAFDHDSDANARRIFGLMAGAGIPANVRLGSEERPVGDSADTLLTIAELLGIKPEVQAAGLVSSIGRSWFDRV